MAVATTMELTFPRSIDSLPRVFEAIEDFLTGLSMNEEARFAISFSVEELFTNLVKYNPSSRTDIVLELVKREGEVEVSVTDPDAEPFDITQKPDIETNKPLAERKPGGLGIHLMKKVLDRIDYQYSDRRSKTTLIKKLE